LDLSELTADEMRQLREQIMARARQFVDPNGIGFDALMQDASDDGDPYFTTDDVTFRDWWDWVQQIVRVIGEGSTRVGLGVMAAGGAIAASHLYTTESGSRYGGIALGVSAVFAAWFVVSAALSAVRGR
jgi:hypothetical protein